MWPPALFMFFLVASEIAYAHTSASQYLVCLDVAQEEQPFGASKTCGFKACQCAARALLVIVRDFVILSLLGPTVVGKGTGFLCAVGGLLSFLNIPLN